MVVLLPGISPTNHLPSQHGTGRQTQVTVSRAISHTTPTPRLKQQQRRRHQLVPMNASSSSNTEPATPNPRMQQGGSDVAADWNVKQAGQGRDPGHSHRPDLHVVLVEPQIPQNTGNVARTCAATNVALHLVGPLGFEIDDKKLKRAGLDYWQHVCVQLHESWQAFFAYFQTLDEPQRLVGYSVYGDQYYAGPEFKYRSGDWLLFGAETTGLPLQAHKDILESGGALVKIPIVDTYVRSLNQSVSVGVGIFEALRQLDEGQHFVAPRDDTNNAMVRLPTPMMLQQHEQLQKEHCGMQHVNIK